MKMHDNASYDVRIVAFVGKDWDSTFAGEEYLFQVIAEGPNHACIAEATGRTIKKAFGELKDKLDLKLIRDSING